MSKATPIEKRRVAEYLGFGVDTDPTTGAPVVIQLGSPKTLDEVADIESRVTGKKVTREGIRVSLLKFGIKPEVADRVQGMSADTVSEAELGISTEDADGSGFRVEDTLAKTAGQGLVDDGGAETKAQREARAQADALLEKAGPTRSVGTSEDAGPINLPNGAKVTDLLGNNAAVIEANTKRILAMPEAPLAFADWLGERYSIEQLPDTIKADWVVEYAQVLSENGNDWNADVENQLTEIAVKLERDADAYKYNRPAAAPARLEVQPESRVSGPDSGAEGAEATDVQARDVNQARAALPAPAAETTKAAEARAEQQRRAAIAEASATTPASEVVQDSAPATEAVQDSAAAVETAQVGEAATEVVRDGVASGNDIETTTRQLGSEPSGAGTRTYDGTTTKESRGNIGSQGKPAGAKPAVRKYSASELAAEVTAFVRVGALGRTVHVVGSLDDLPPHVDKSKLDGDTQGVAITRENGRYEVYLIADQIEYGRGRAVFLHEVGVHTGLEKLLTPAQFARLADFVRRKYRAFHKDNDRSTEAELAYAAEGRMRSAGIDYTDKTLTDSELVAYFVEEAVLSGIDPIATSRGPFAQWFRTLWAAFKTALHRLGVNSDKLTAKDVVDMAYGAARLEMAGTYHGTAAQFRRFNHKYMSSGEGAQAFGWGTYLAQRYGVARDYWKADVKRKSPRAKAKLTWGDGSELSKADLSDLSLMYDLDTNRNLRVYESFSDRLNDNWRENAETLLADRKKVIAAEDRRVAIIKAAEDRYAEVKAANSNGTATLSDLMAAQKQLFQDKKSAGFKDFSYSQRAQEAELLKKVLDIGLKLDTGAPEGSLMRVDVGVKDSEMLDWDAVIAKQPFVLDRIGRYMPPSLREAIEAEVNLSVGDMTGEYLYRALEQLESREGMVRELFDAFDSRLADVKAKQLVSMYLDEQLGIPALKFWDQPSRKASTDRTKNIVVFNDKNVFRVGSQIGAKPDRMRFSKAAPSKPDYLSKAPSELADLASSVTKMAKDWTFTRDLLEILCDWDMRTGRN